MTPTQVYVDPNTRYPVSLFDVSGKERVIFGFEEHCRAKADGWSEERQQVSKRGPGRPPKEVTE